VDCWLSTILNVSLTFYLLLGVFSDSFAFRSTSTPSTIDIEKKGCWLCIETY